MSGPSDAASLSDLPNAWLAVELRQLLIHPSPQYSDLTYATKDRPKHPSFENFECLQRRPRLIPIENHLSYKRLIQVALRTSGMFTRPEGLVESVVGTTTGDDDPPT